MRKGHYRSVLLIAAFLVIFEPSIHAWPGVPVGSAAAGFQGSAQVGSGAEGVALSGLGAGIHMLQFKAGGHLLGFQPGKVYFASLDHALSVEFLGTPGVMPKAAARGKERGKESRVPSLGEVVYEGLWEGISLTYEAGEGGIAESTYHIEPWGDVSKIRLGYNVPVEVQRDGSLKFKFDRGYLTESSPEAWQEIGGERVPVPVAFRVKGGEVGFSVGPYDPNYPLTIDPTYAWHTFYWSSNIDYGYENIMTFFSGVATDGSGNVYVTGWTDRTWNGPAGQSPLHAYSGYFDIFVLKLDSSGAYQWHTFFGSGVAEEGNAIAIDGSGNVYVAGTSAATWNGPTGQSPLHAYGGGNSDIFVLKLNSSGAYQWHTFYGAGSPYNDRGYGIATDATGNLYVTGQSEASWNGPAGQSPLHAFSGIFDIFVLKLNGSGAYQWHTFYGSGGVDWGYDIATDASANVYVTGNTMGYWTGPAGQSPLHGDCVVDDIFVLKLDSSGGYQWHTFYGSSSCEGYGAYDYGYNIAVDGSGNVYVTGESEASWNGPTVQSPLHAYSGNQDIFVLKLNSNGAYQWHTFYGSSGADYGHGIRADAGGNVYITGESNATWNGPAGQSPLHAYSGGYDIFMLKLNGNGAYQGHIFFGSSSNDYGYAMGTDGSGNVFVTGLSSATWNGPAGQSPLHAHSGNGHYDLFVLKINNMAKSDFNGDGKAEFGIYAYGVWYLDLSGNGAWDSAPTDGLYYFGGGLTGAVPVTGDWNGTGTAKIGMYVNGVWYIDLNGNGAWDGTPTDALYYFGGGLTGAMPVTGDWTGTGTTKISVYHNGVWYLDLNGNGMWDGEPTDGIYYFGGGLTGAIPVTGDWTGTGTTKIGVYWDGIWYLDLNGNGIWDGTPTDGFYYFGGGLAEAVPVVSK